MPHTETRMSYSRAQEDYQTSGAAYGGNSRLSYESGLSASNQRINFSVYVGQVNLSVEKRDLYQLFAPFGAVNAVFISPAKDAMEYTFAFIRYRYLESAKKAVASLQDWPLKGTKIHVEFSKELQQRRSADAFQKKEVQQNIYRSRQENSNDRLMLWRLKQCCVHLNKLASESSGGERGAGSQKRVDYPLLMARVNRHSVSLCQPVKYENVNCKLDLEKLDKQVAKSKEKTTWPTQPSKMMNSEKPSQKDVAAVLLGKLNIKPSLTHSYHNGNAFINPSDGQSPRIPPSPQISRAEDRSQDLMKNILPEHQKTSSGETSTTSTKVSPVRNTIHGDSSTKPGLGLSPRGLLLNGGMMRGQGLNQPLSPRLVTQEIRDKNDAIVKSVLLEGRKLTKAVSPHEHSYSGNDGLKDLSYDKRHIAQTTSGQAVSLCGDGKGQGLTTGTPALKDSQISPSYSQTQSFYSSDVKVATPSMASSDAEWEPPKNPPHHYHSDSQLLQARKLSSSIKHGAAAQSRPQNDTTSCKSGENTTAGTVGLRGSSQDQNGNFVKESPPRSIARGKLMASFARHTSMASKSPGRQTSSSGDARMYRSAYSDTEAMGHPGHRQSSAHSTNVQSQNPYAGESGSEVLSSLSSPEELYREPPAPQRLPLPQHNFHSGTQPMNSDGQQHDQLVMQRIVKQGSPSLVTLGTKEPKSPVAVNHIPTTKSAFAPKAHSFGRGKGGAFSSIGRGKAKGN